MNSEIKKSSKKKLLLQRNLRWIVLLIILALSTGLGVIHQLFRNLRTINVDQLCPFGALESLYAYFRTGQLIARVGVSSFILMIFVVLVTILFRRAFCGHFCPLGTLQEIFDRLGRKVFKKRLVVPEVLDRPLRLGKYIVLILIVGFSWYFGRLIIRPYDPWAAYHHLTSHELFDEFLIGFLILVFSLFFSFLYQRFFCKYLCPLGGFVAFLAPIGMTTIHRHAETCTQCLACDKICPVNIKVSQMDKVTSLECIQCHECVNVCPVKNTLVIKISGRKKIRSSHVIAVILAIYLLLVGLSTLSGHFHWIQPNLAKQAQQAQKRGAVLDPENITGRMTLQEVVEAYDIPQEVFSSRFQLESDDFNIPLRDMEAVSTGDLRVFVKEYLDQVQKP